MDVKDVVDVVRRRGRAAAVAAVVAVPLVMGPALPADAAPVAKKGTPGCVTKGEFKKVKKGWTKKRVHARFGTNGARFDRQTVEGVTFETRRYKPCKGRTTILVDYVDRRLDSKARRGIGLG